MKRAGRTPYLAYFRMTFRQNTAYRVEWLFGILDSVIQIFISIAIWKALYGTRDAVNGVGFSVIATNFIISLGLSNIFSTNDFAIQQKINDGSIANELLKPVDYRKILLAQTLAEIAFRFLSNFLPTFLITSLVFGILPPAGIVNFLLYLVSMFLGFCVLWSLSLIIQMTAFWIMNVWSISTIKNVFVKVLAGAALPLYFMPEPVMKVIRFTPFDSIYHIPLQIYLGNATGEEIVTCIVKQIVWIALLYSISVLMWYRGSKKIVIQGALFLFIASLSFFIIKVNNIRNVFYYDTRQFAGYPVSIYPKFLQVLMIYIVPFAFVNFFPVQFILRKDDMGAFPAAFMYIAPAVGFVLYALAYAFWRFSLKHYHSSGN